MIESRVALVCLCALALALLPTTASSCDPQKSTLTWPVAGKVGQDWAINNYVDLDGRDGLILDYLGGQRVYDGHNALDIDITSFRAMAEGVNVLAAADGQVTRVEDGHQDRSVQSNANLPRNQHAKANFIVIRHDGDILTRYLHLKRGAMKVKPGDQVITGQPIAEVGSSGSSTWPHLHFEVLDCGGTARSPFAESLFVDPPEYQQPLQLMDVVLRGAALPQEQLDRKRLIISEDENATRIPYGGYLTIATIQAGGKAGDSIKVAIRYKNGRTYREAAAAISGHGGRGYFHWYWRMEPLSENMRVDVEINGEVVRSEDVTVIM